MRLCFEDVIVVSSRFRIVSATDGNSFKFTQDLLLDQLRQCGDSAHGSDISRRQGDVEGHLRSRSKLQAA
jgi:hypothetical protein